MGKIPLIYKCRISGIADLTHDTREYHLDIPAGASFSFFPGDHIKIYPDPAEPLEFRTYTPTNIPEIKDHFELIIKAYPLGYVSKYMHGRKPGDEISISGPHFGGHWEDGLADRAGMIAGGTGITPMISMIRSIIQKKLRVDISLLYANKTIDDIILKNEFDDLAASHANFKRYYVLDKAPENWDMGNGFINESMIRSNLSPPDPRNVIFVCGPPMMQLEIRRILVEIGHAKENIIFP